VEDVAYDRAQIEHESEKVLEWQWVVEDVAYDRA